MFLLYDGSKYIPVDHEQLFMKNEIINPKYSWVPLYHTWIDIFYIFSFHLFKNYENNGDCIDMELSYYLECSSFVEAGKSGTVAICQENGEFHI